MFKAIFSIIRNILASFGLSVIVFIYICMATDLPTSLFNSIKVDPKIQSSDVIVVLGAGVTKNGWPNRYSLERTVKGVILYKKGYASKILFTGGLAHDEYIAPATAMAKMAEDLGIPPSSIIVENKSLDTYENAVFTQKLMKENDLKTAIVVTSDSHMRRSLLVFNKLGVIANPAPVEEAIISPEDSLKARIKNINIMYQVLYEAVGIIKYKHKGWL